MLPPTIRENDLPFLPHVGAGVGAGVASRYNRGYKVSTSKKCERGGWGGGGGWKGEMLHSFEKFEGDFNIFAKTYDCKRS